MNRLRCLGKFQIGSRGSRNPNLPPLPLPLQRPLTPACVFLGSLHSDIDWNIVQTGRVTSVACSTFPLCSSRGSCLVDLPNNSPPPPLFFHNDSYLFHPKRESFRAYMHNTLGTKSILQISHSPYLPPHGTRSSSVAFFCPLRYLNLLQRGVFLFFLLSPPSYSRGPTSHPVIA